MPTLAEIKRELPTDASTFPHLSDADFDALLDDLTDRETERVEERLDVTLGVATATVDTARPSSAGGPDLPLPQRPVQSVQSISVDTTRVGGAAVAPSDVRVEPTHLALEPAADRHTWPTERRSVTVTYDYGYPADDLPDVVDAAIIGLVRQAVVDIEAAGITRETVGGESTNYELSDDVVARHISRAAAALKLDYHNGAQVI